MKKRIMLMLTGFLLTACTQNPKPFTANLTDVGFDTYVGLTLYTDSEDDFNEYQKQVLADFQHYNQLFDKYNDYEGIHNIKTINDQAGKAPVKVDPEIIDMLKLSKEYSDKTDSQFDITMGPVLEIWHRYREEGTKANEEGRESRLPSMEELNSAKACVGWNQVEIDEQAQTVFLKNTCASLDVGSVAKGYAAEKAAQHLEEAGIASGIVNAGGNVRLIGTKPDDKPWSVGIQIPNLISLQTDAIANISLPSASSFVTSGDYQRYYTYQDRIMHHIIDPKTLLPANHFRSVTVIDKSSSATADILSTSLFTLTYEEGNALIERLQKEGHDLEAIWVFDDTTAIPENAETLSAGDYTLIATDGIKDHLTLSK